MELGTLVHDLKYNDTAKHIGTFMLKSFDDLIEEGWKVVERTPTVSMLVNPNKIVGDKLLECECQVLGQLVDVYVYRHMDDYEGTEEESDTYDLVIHGVPWSSDIEGGKAIYDVEDYKQLIKGEC